MVSFFLSHCSLRQNLYKFKYPVKLTLKDSRTINILKKQTNDKKKKENQIPYVTFYKNTAGMLLK